MFDELNDEISRAEIFKACKELSIGKSGGFVVLVLRAGFAF